MEFILEITFPRFDEFSRFDDLHSNHCSPPHPYKSNLALDRLNEQLHWTLLMTGFFLADSPSSPSLTPYVSSSPLARTIASRILSFFDSLSDISNEKWSPQVVETLYWWLERWGSSYLFVGTDAEGEEVLVPGGTSWMQVARWVVGRMRKDVVGWAAEPEIISQVWSRKAGGDVDYTYSEDIWEGGESEEWVTCLRYICFELADTDNMPELVEYLIHNISDLPQASHA
jgi:hypothetical protein